MRDEIDEARARLHATNSGKPYQPCNCGRISAHSKVAWRKLGKYPHYPGGNPSRYAYRLAALATRSQVESGFNQLKTGCKVANGGEERTRIREMKVVHAIIELAALSRTALSIYDYRLQTNLLPGTSPASPAQEQLAA